jgi:hypothetical protein
MNYRGAITTDIARLLDVFAPSCEDRETMDWLRDAAQDRSKWIKAHGVFNHIRTKYLKAERSKNEMRMAQYRFEEICAKTIHNIGGPPAPFDADSPYWVVPNAISFARVLGLADTEVLSCLSLQHAAPAA